MSRKPRGGRPCKGGALFPLFLQPLPEVLASASAAPASAGALPSRRGRLRGVALPRALFGSSAMDSALKAAWRIA